MQGMFPLFLLCVVINIVIVIAVVIVTIIIIIIIISIIRIIINYYDLYHHLIIIILIFVYTCICTYISYTSLLANAACLEMTLSKDSILIYCHYLCHCRRHYHCYCHYLMLLGCKQSGRTWPIIPEIPTTHFNGIVSNLDSMRIRFSIK